MHLNAIDFKLRKALSENSAVENVRHKRKCVFYINHLTSNALLHKCHLRVICKKQFFRSGNIEYIFIIFELTLEMHMTDINLAYSEMGAIDNGNTQVVQSANQPGWWCDREYGFEHDLLVNRRMKKSSWWNGLFTNTYLNLQIIKHWSFIDRYPLNIQYLEYRIQMIWNSNPKLPK